ncbi:glycosyltransferase family 4 protein [Zhongshania aliphaticivorans]|uniref:Glycosyl transferase family 1 domain-containing protein n=1 Tax=Zhongshania aliphaticivorans TaxID=1470434 RepID=A0A127M163_9GAMM|nr:glycosyltransferase family 4 protein [Zhongshania aliphaticivorans]AMO66978.1 hypothetical protein AZF00_01090 [Zhongshania aliphaticivorans]
MILIVHQSLELYGSDKSIIDMANFLLSKTDSGVIFFLPEGNGLGLDYLRQMQSRYGHRLRIYQLDVCKVDRSAFGLLGVAKLLRSIFFMLFFVLRNRKEFAEVKFVHTNTVAVFGGVVVASVLNVPHVWNVREIIERPKLASVFLRLMVRCFSRLVISNSEATGSWVRIFGGGGKYFVVNNGVRPPEVSSGSFNRYRDNSKVMLGLVGRISEWKGHMFLLDIVSELVSRGYKDFKVVVVGDAHSGNLEFLRNFKDKIQSLSLVEFVELIPFVDSVGDVYKSIDILLVPSLQPEPFGRVAVEAMSLGVPVVASDAGGLQDIVKHGESGYLVEPADVEKFVVAIGILMADRSLRSSMGEMGSRRYLDRFTDEQCFLRYLEIFGEINEFNYIRD